MLVIRFDLDSWCHSRGSIKQDTNDRRVTFYQWYHHTVIWSQRRWASRHSARWLSAKLCNGQAAGTASASVTAEAILFQQMKRTVRLRILLTWGSSEENLKMFISTTGSHPARLITQAMIVSLNHSTVCSSACTPVGHPHVRCLYSSYLVPQWVPQQTGINYFL